MAAADDTDFGNSQRLIAAGVGVIRHEYAANRWHVWDGRVWREDTASVMELAKTTALDHLARVLSDPDRRGTRSDEFARRSLSSPRLKAAIELARSDRRLAVDPTTFDADAHLLNTPSGVVDLRSGDLLAHDSSRLMRSITAAAYNPNATCPLWEASLLRAMGGDAELVAYLQRVGMIT